eukprot:3571447-Prymnesium_polylepis.1
MCTPGVHVAATCRCSRGWRAAPWGLTLGPTLAREGPRAPRRENAVNPDDRAPVGGPAATWRPRVGTGQNKKRARAPTGAARLASLWGGPRAVSRWRVWGEDAGLGRLPPRARGQVSRRNEAPEPRRTAPHLNGGAISGARARAPRPR